jgi:beta-ureidopropionase
MLPTQQILSQLSIANELLESAKEANFELKGFQMKALDEQLRRPRRVRVAAIQNKIVISTSATVQQQRDAIHNRVRKLGKFTKEKSLKLHRF